LHCRNSDIRNNVQLKITFIYRLINCNYKTWDGYTDLDSATTSPEHH